MNRTPVYNRRGRRLSDLERTPRAQLERAQFWGSEGQTFGAFWGSTHGRLDAYYTVKVTEGLTEPSIPWVLTPFLEEGYEELGPPAPADRVTLLLDAVRHQRNAGAWQRRYDGRLRLYDGTDLDERPHWIDDRSLDSIEYWLADPGPTQAPPDIAEALRPFLERRTEKQRLTLYARYWEGATFREASALLGSNTSGTRAGSAVSNARQALKMLRRDLLAAFAPDDDPDELPKCLTCTGRFYTSGWKPIGLRAGRASGAGVRFKALPSGASSSDVRTRRPTPAERAKWGMPTSPEPRRYPDPAELEAGLREVRADEAAMIDWGARGCTSGDIGGRNVPADSAGFVHIGSAVRRGPGGDVPTAAASTALPERESGAPWRSPHPRKTPAEQAALDYVEDAAAPAEIAALMRRAPGDADRGTGLHPSTIALQKVRASLKEGNESG